MVIRFSGKYEIVVAGAGNCQRVVVMAGLDEEAVCPLFGTNFRQDKI